MLTISLHPFLFACLEMTFWLKQITSPNLLPGNFYVIAKCQSKWNRIKCVKLKATTFKLQPISSITSIKIKGNIAELVVCWYSSLYQNNAYRCRQSFTKCWFREGEISKSKNLRIYVSLKPESTAEPVLVHKKKIY